MEFGQELVPALHSKAGPKTEVVDTQGRCFVWTRMGVEAGESLTGILQRKELERRAGNGNFVWGVGNAPGSVTPSVLRQFAAPKAVFSPIRSRPRPVDVAPASVLIWQAYRDQAGQVRELPTQSLVTSRNPGTSKTTRHYALFCFAADPIDSTGTSTLNYAALANFASGRPVGQTQVTALVREHLRGSPGGSKYQVNFEATLIGPMWTELLMPAVLTEKHSDLLKDVGRSESSDEWLDAVQQVRNSISSQ